MIHNRRPVITDSAYARVSDARNTTRGTSCSWRRISSILLALLLTTPVLARAQGVGFVGGGTIDPEGFYVGTFFETPPISGTIHVRPGVDGVWGQGLRIASINIDIVHRADVGTGWQFYTGGGPVISITRFDDSLPTPDVNDVTGGFGALLGFLHSSGFLFEFKYGYVRNASTLKIGAGVKIGSKHNANP